MDFKNSRKRSMHKQSKKFLAGFLAVLLTVCMLPVDLFGVSAAVYAAEEQETLVPEEETGVAAATDDKFTEEDAETASDVVTETLETESDETQAVETDVAEEDVSKTESSSDEDGDATETNLQEVLETVEATETTVDKENEDVRADSIFSKTDKTSIWDFSSVAGSGKEVKAGGEIEGIKVIAAGSVKHHASKYLTMKANAVLGIPLDNDTGSVDIVFVYNSLSDGRTIVIGDSTEDQDNSVGGKTRVLTHKKEIDKDTLTYDSRMDTDIGGRQGYKTPYMSVIDGKKYLKITVTNGEQKINTIKITERSGDTPPDPLPDLSTATVEFNMSDVEGWNNDKSEAAYTGVEVRPSIKVIVGNNTLDAKNYTLQFARSETEPAEEEYKDASEVDLVSLGKIYMRAVATTNNVEYEGKTNPVSYKIVKGVAPAINPLSYVADTSTATTEQQNADSMEQTIDLSEFFVFDSIYGTATLKNARIDDGETTNNVLAAAPDINLTNSILTFNTKANVPKEDQVKATIKVDAEFEKYETATLVIEVMLAQKTAVTIEGITVEKIYDGTEVVPSIENLVIKADEQKITDQDLIESLIFTYATESGEILENAPKNVGRYMLTVSVPLNNELYSGKSDTISFTIEKAPLTITAKNRDWFIGYTAPTRILSTWYEIIGLADGETIETITGAEVKFAYKIGEDEITDWTTLKVTDEVIIVPVLDGLSNYEVTAINGKLTIKEDAQLNDNEHELNLTKDWHVGDASAMLHNGDDKKTDGYFTINANAKTAGEGNAYPLITYDKYENVLKMSNGTEISFNAPKDSVLEFIVHTYDKDGAAKLNVDNKEAISGATGAEGVTVEVLGNGVPVKPYGKFNVTADSEFKIYKVTITLTADGVHKIARSKGESQLYYVKVTEPKTTSDDNEQYTVTFKNGADTFKTETVASGTELSLSDIKPADQAGKVFKGWAAKENATAADVVTSITPTEDTTLYAVWVNVYTITLKNGDQTVGTPVTVEAGESYTLPKLEDTDTEYFMGWKNADTTDTEVYEASITPTKDTILNAYFKNKADAKFYAVTIDYGYKENEADDNNKKEIIRKEYTTDGEEVTVTLDELGTPVRTGYTFDKWMAGDAEVPAEGLKIKADITITAIWTKNSTAAEKYAVIFADTAGNKVVTTDVLDKAGNKVNPAEVEKDTTILLPDTTEKKEGYIWTWTTEDKKEYKAGAEYIVTGNVTFTGDWVKEGDDTPTDPEVKTIKLSECEIAVPSIIADAKKNPKNESKTSVVYYTDKDKDGNPINPVRFAEGLDFTVEYKIKADNVYTATIQGAGRTVDQYRLDTAPENNVVKEYKIYTKNDKNVIDLSKAKVVLDGTEKTAVYTGYGITPEVKSVKVGKTDIPSTQYKVSYKSNVNAGKASVIITADSDAQNEGGNFVIGSKTVTFTIKKAAINKKQVTVTAKDKKGKVFGSEEYAYRGIDEVRIAELSVVSSGGRKLRENIDYTVSYKNNRKAGKATATIKGIGNNISGSVNIPFTIKELSFAEYKEYAPLYGLEYSPNGAKVQYMCVFKTQGDEILDMIVLEEGVDFKGSYKYEDRNKKAGTEVTFSGKAINACKGIFTEAKFPIGQAQFDGSVEVDGQILVDVTKSDLTGANLQKALEKAVVVKDYFGIKMKPKKDYVIEPNEANGTVAIKPSEAIKGNYLEEHQSITCSYEKAKNIAKLKDVSFSKNYTLYYDGRNPVELGAREIAEIGNYQFVLGRDVEIVEGSYKNNYKAGNASVTIRGINGSGFYGQKVLKFKIVEK